MAVTHSYSRMFSTANIIRKFLRGSRLFNSSSTLQNKNRESRMLQKMLSSREERKMWNLGPQTHKSQPMHGKRAKVLNKMLMLNVTQAMMREEFDDVLGNRGVQVTRVSVDENYEYLLVYWVAKDSEDPLEVQSILDGLSGLVRSQLMYSNKIGKLPQIRFQRDLDELQYQVVLDVFHQLQSSSSVEQVMLEEAPMPALSQVDGIPAMRQDTFGLRHDHIMSKILRCKESSFPLTFPVPPASCEMRTPNENRSAQDDEVTKNLQHEREKEAKKFIAHQKKSFYLNTNHKVKNYKHDKGGIFRYDDDDDDG